MTPTPGVAPRRGVTLIELLVVMSILLGLLALALMLIPNINNQNATVKGAGEVQAMMRAAQSMAANARMPRGVRFIVSTKLNGYISTEMQFLEIPPIIVSDPKALSAPPGAPTAGDPFGASSGVVTVYGPRVELVYALGGPPTAPVQNTIISRRCFIRGMTQEQAEQVTTGATLILPTLGSWSRVFRVVGWIPPSPPLASTSPAPGPYLYTSPRSGLTSSDLEVELEVYPDAQLGVATSYRTYHFGLYGMPVPLLAEGTVPLPENIGVDLQISYPPLPPVGARRTPDYDVMFSPDGPMISTYNTAANANAYLWVRDVSKVTNPGNAAADKSMYPPDFNGNYPAYVDAYRRGGEQLLVGVRAGGFVGTAPALPAPPGGSFNAHDPFQLARQQLDK